MFVLLLVAELRDDLAARHSERVFHVAHDGAGVGVHDAPTEDEGGVVEGVVAEREGRRVGAGVRTEVGRVAEVAVEGRGVDVAGLRRMSLGAVRGALVPREGFGGVEDRLLRGGEGGRGFHLGGRAGDDLVDGGEGAGDEGGRIDIVARRRRRVVGVGGANVCFPRDGRGVVVVAGRRDEGTGGAARRETRASDARGRGRAPSPGCRALRDVRLTRFRDRGAVPKSARSGICPGAAARRERRAAHL